MFVPSRARTLLVGLRATVLLTLIVGVVYTGALTGLGQLLLHDPANGSRLVVDGRVVGSSRIGQNFEKDGHPLAKYFQPRPSAAGDDGYDGSSSSGSNMGPENPDLAKDIRARRAAVAAFCGVRPEQVPADAVTASSSGLDPDISPAYAAIQVARVARARHLDQATVRRIVSEHTSGPQLGFLGQSRVNVLGVNAALDEHR